MAAQVMCRKQARHSGLYTPLGHSVWGSGFYHLYSSEGKSQHLYGMSELQVKTYKWKCHKWKRLNRKFRQKISQRENMICTEMKPCSVKQETMHHFHEDLEKIWFSMMESSNFFLKRTNHINFKMYWSWGNDNTNLIIKTSTFQIILRCCELVKSCIWMIGVQKCREEYGIWVGPWRVRGGFHCQDREIRTERDIKNIKEKCKMSLQK